MKNNLLPAVPELAEGLPVEAKHTNFLVNLGGGTYDEAMYLIGLAQEKVLKEFGIKLELEIKIL